jgi:hypothetical protein
MMRHQRFRRWLNLALLAILAWLPLGAVDTARANHPTTNPTFYLAGMRVVDWPETTCVDTLQTGLISFEEALNRIYGTLAFARPDRDWNEFYAGHITFEFIYGQHCDLITDVPWGEIELRYYVQTPDSPPCIFYSCARRGGDQWVDEPTGRVEWTKYNVYLKDESLVSDDEVRYRHLINHETGHVFGLDDPREGCEGQAVDSVMHPEYDPYYCQNGPRRPYPTDLDFETVRALIDGR